MIFMGRLTYLIDVTNTYKKQFKYINIFEMILILRCLSNLSLCLQYFKSRKRNQDHQCGNLSENSEIFYPEYIKTRRQKNNNEQNDVTQSRRDHQIYNKTIQTLSQAKSIPDINLISDQRSQKFSQGFQQIRNKNNITLDLNTLQTQQEQKNNTQQNEIENTKQSMRQIESQNKLNLQPKKNFLRNTFMVIHQKNSEQENESEVQQERGQQIRSRDFMCTTDVNFNDQSDQNQKKKRTTSRKQQFDLQTRIKKKLRNRRKKSEEDIYTRSPYRVNLPKDLIQLVKVHQKKNIN